MFGAAMGTMNVDVSEDDGATWTNVWSLSGDQGNAWTEASIDLSSYTGQIDLRIQAVGGAHLLLTWQLTLLDLWSCQFLVVQILMQTTIILLLIRRWVLYICWMLPINTYYERFMGRWLEWKHIYSN